MKILLVTDSYPPEIRSASHLMEDLALYLENSGFDVTVITTWPEYNLSEGVKGKVFDEVDVESGIKVVRVKTIRHHNVGYILRGMSQILMPFQFLYKLRKLRIEVDSILVYSPPLPLALVGLILKLFHRKRVVINIQDLFPKNAIDLGILKNKIAIKFFKVLESVIYRNADFLTVHSNGNLKIILDEYPELSKKFSIVHNWIDFSRFETSSLAKIDFRSRWGINSKYIAVFAGVMGPSQNLDLILWIAQKIQLTHPDLNFLLVGDGSEKKRLMALARDKNITNVNFQPFISRGEYIDLLSICDVGLVSLSPKNETPVVPGKILDYMAAGVPVAAFLQRNSDGHQIINSAQCGISADSEFPDACLSAFLEFLAVSHNFKKMGQAGNVYGKNHFTRNSCAGLIKELLIK